MKKILIGLSLVTSLSTLASNCNLMIKSSGIQGIKSGNTVVRIEDQLSDKGFNVVYEKDVAAFVLTLKSGQERIEQGGSNKWYNNILSLGGVSAQAKLETSKGVIFQRVLSEKTAFAPMDRAQKLLEEAVSGVPSCN